VLGVPGGVPADHVEAGDGLAADLSDVVLEEAVVAAGASGERRPETYSPPHERHTLDRGDQPRSATLGTLRILEGAGYYPYVECPAELAPPVNSSLAEHVRA
jgi:hypothetical protein